MFNDWSGAHNFWLDLHTVGSLFSSQIKSNPLLVVHNALLAFVSERSKGDVLCLDLEALGSDSCMLTEFDNFRQDVDTMVSLFLV